MNGWYVDVLIKNGMRAQDDSLMGSGNTDSLLLLFFFFLIHEK